MCSEYINHWYNWEGKWSLNENENLHLDLIQLEMTTCMHDLQLLTGWANSQVEPTGTIVYEVECAQNRATYFVGYWLKVQLVPTDASPVAYNFLNSSVSYEVEYSFFNVSRVFHFSYHMLGTLLTSGYNGVRFRVKISLAAASCTSGWRSILTASISSSVSLPC